MESDMIATRNSTLVSTGPIPHSPLEERDDCLRVMRSGLSLLALCLLLWGLFYLVWRLVPEVTPGSLRVYDAKLAVLTQPGLFGKDAQFKALFVGLSYTMTGFKPEAFDQLSHGTCSSYNLGLPIAIFGRRTYTLPEMLALLESSGQTPTDILLTWREPWPPGKAEPPRSVSARFTPKWDNAAVIQVLFPFRQLARDGSIFLARSIKHGGPVAFTRSCNHELQSCLNSRGYYFIKTESIYPKDQLPENYAAKTDAPNLPLNRPVEVWEEYIRWVRKAAPTVRLFLVPNYYRANSCAPSPSNARLREALAKYNVLAIGPDYFQYPNHLFSDAAHLNPAGADVYTRDLWNLLREHFSQLPATALERGASVASDPESRTAPNASNTAPPAER